VGPIFAEGQPLKFRGLIFVDVHDDAHYTVSLISWLAQKPQNLDPVEIFRNTVSAFTLNYTCCGFTVLYPPWIKTEILIIIHSS
jgi:hypothetical protein